MNKVHKRRLLNVARALRESEIPKAFTMRMYTHERDFAGGCGCDQCVRECVERIAALPSGTTCRTPACALGHYYARPDLQRLGRIDDAGKIPYVYDDPPVLRHFGLTYAEATELFAGHGCGDARTPMQAAQYIERFVARHA